MNNSVKITRYEKIKEVQNEWVHNFYYLFYGRIYTKDRKAYQKIKFIIWFDSEDLAEFYDKYTINQREIKEYAKELAIIFVPNWDMIAENCSQFLNDCNDTIKRYNGTL